MSEPTTLYRAYDQDGALLYVGIARNWGRRWSQHSERSAWFGRVASLRLETFATRQEARTAERRAVETEKPAHNIEFTNRDTRRFRHRPTGVSIAPNFDYRALPADAYHKLAEAIDGVIKACKRDDERSLLTQSRLDALLLDLSRSVRYADCCDRCGLLEIAYPIVQQIDRENVWLRAGYAHICGHVWTCGWTADLDAMAAW